MGVPGEKRQGTVKFSNNNGWPYQNNDTINIKSFDGPVKEALYGTNGYEKYIKQTISTATVRLITKKEIEDLINDGKELSRENIRSRVEAKGYSWLYSTSYWTQSAHSIYYDQVWTVNANYVFEYTMFRSQVSNGVRPVITIPLS